MYGVTDTEEGHTRVSTSVSMSASHDLHALMEIDVSQLTVARLEALVAAFLVCDWNVRAWTLLEAMRGCHSLRVLCKNEQIVSLRECFTRLHKEGRLDLGAALVLACQHPMPSSEDPFRRLSSRKTLESAGNLLSLRHATRAGDDIVIWSLISNTKVHYSAEEMWKGVVGRRIKTAFFMSNCPRLCVPGFSWAPETPYIRRKAVGAGNPLDLFFVYDGADSEGALVNPKGLEGDWQVYRLDRVDDERYNDAPVTSWTILDNGHHKEQIMPGQRVVNHCWRTAIGLLDGHAEVALIQPIATTSRGRYSLSSGRGESHGEVFAICVSDGGEKWFWKVLRAGRG